MLEKTVTEERQDGVGVGMTTSAYLKSSQDSFLPLLPLGLQTYKGYHLREVASYCSPGCPSPGKAARGRDWLDSVSGFEPRSWTESISHFAC